MLLLLIVISENIIPLRRDFAEVWQKDIMYYLKFFNIMTKEIGDINLGRMTNGAHYLFMSDILARAKADEHVMANCGERVEVLDDAVAQEDVDLKISQKSLFTDYIAQADRERDVHLMLYHKALESYYELSAPAYAEAVRILMQHWKDYGLDPQMQLDRETGMLINFINDLETKYANEVETLGFGNFVSNIKAANECVREQTAARTEERMGQRVGALKNSRKNSDVGYRLLIKTVNAHAWLEGDAEYGDFIDYVNTQIKHYKREVLGQKTDSSAGTPDDAPAEGGGDTTPDETPGEGGTPSGGETPDTGGSDSGTEEGGTTPPATGGGDDDDNGGSLVG